MPKRRSLFTPVNERLMKLRLKVGSLWLSLIAVYAPMEVDDPIKAEEFYEQLQSLINDVNQKDVANAR